ncbi:MAG: hypothetical protein IT561_12735 [Alphaproteobacteria bacterium]|nr:hypothetical protein [Alphaproteobacteria bacterium]
MEVQETQMPRTPSALLPVALLLAAACASTARAQDATEDRWTFSITPYLWAAGVKGDVTVPSRLHPSGAIESSVDAKFTDILSNLGGVPFMGMAEANYGRFSLLGDILYLKLETDGDTKGPAFGGTEARLTNTIGSMIGTYRAIDVPGHRLELGGGFRVWSMTTKLSLSPGALAGGSASKTATWADPVLAARYRVRLSDQFSLSLYGDIGGFGVGSDFAWQVLATVDYAVTPTIDLRFGYRYLAFEYEGDRARFDLNFHGPFLAATFKF